MYIVPAQLSWGPPLFASILYLTAPRPSFCVSSLHIILPSPKMLDVPELVMLISPPFSPTLQTKLKIYYSSTP